MITTKLAPTLAAVLLFTAPQAAFAQNQPVDTPAEAFGENAEAAEDKDVPVAARTYEPINYDPAFQPENVWVLDLSNGQRVKVRLQADWAPAHVERIKTLTRAGFYNGVVFHRVIEGFMAQGGDPTATGQGGSELPDLKAEFNPMPHVRGTLSMARAAEEDSANSQFFIVFYPRFSLDKKYTNFGRVIENMEAVDAINRGEPPAEPTFIVQASLASDNLAPPAPPAPVAETPISADMLSAPIG
ncbi:peptidylprolyl isomerase [Erythrobacter sp. R86502]|uniref:peptidylprolyl isomerase n=1 Tax=Erythrobacter sp. R86502 TaxID=3093846 RepID=UPI0036D227B3